MRTRLMGLVLLATVGVLVYAMPHALLAPGDLAADHADASGSCFDCHAALRGVPDDRCRACHDSFETGSLASFHERSETSGCVRCHTDHAGADAALSEDFDHGALPSSFRDDCLGCHSAPADDLHNAAGGDCAECHGTEAWTPADFEHARFFRFDRHHPSTCSDCHRGQDLSTWTCYGCHEHSARKIAHEHREEGIRDFDDCVACHRSGDEDEAKRRWRDSERGRRRGHRGDHDDDDDDDDDDNLC